VANLDYYPKRRDSISIDMIGKTIEEKVFVGGRVQVLCWLGS